MQVHILTLFPRIFDGLLRESILGRAVEKDLLTVETHDIRAYSTDKHHRVDDRPFGGGPGMVLKPEPVFAAVEDVCGNQLFRRILLSPRGRRFDQALAHNLAGEERLLLLCGRYEGFDERIRIGLDFEEISIGDFVLTGGEVAAMAILEAVGRLLPGVLGDAESAVQESFENGLLDCPQYTRPVEFRGMEVPEVLRSGDHGKIEEWRRREALEQTRTRRPDLMDEQEGKQERQE